jgi:hypothetical protein
MIQRIQTIYLLFALVLLIACCFVPLAVLIFTGNVFSLSILQFEQGKLEIPLWGFPSFLSGLIIIIDLVIIFLFKKRKRQMQLCIVNIILLICLNLLLFYQCLLLKNTGIQVTCNIAIVFPVLSAVFTYLAYGKIKKDENLVHSYERLR